MRAFYLLPPDGISVFIVVSPGDRGALNLKPTCLISWLFSLEKAISPALSVVTGTGTQLPSRVFGEVQVRLRTVIVIPNV